jgi:ABC-type antimicrobial peptide transport system permease subunit
LVSEQVGKNILPKLNTTQTSIKNLWERPNRLASVGLYAVIARMALIGVSPGDPVTFIAIVLVLVIAGVLGCAIPARRAMRVDPIVALRYE